MKISIDIDCSAEEARELLGLPDVKPMQDAWLASMQKKMQTDLENASPQSLIEGWLAASTVNADWMQRTFGMMAGGAGGKGKEKEKGDT